MIKGIIVRYTLILLLLILFSTELFVKVMQLILTTLSYLFLNLIIDVSIQNWIIFTLEFGFIVVKECIAPSAYMIITLMIFSISSDIKNLIIDFIKCILLFTLFNLIRIIILIFSSNMFGIEFFNQFHMIIYQFLSGFIVALIILLIIRKYLKNSKYPVYTDIINIVKQIKN